MDQFFRGFIKNFFLVISYCAFSYGSFYSQTLSINEFSNGPSGTKEYIEFIVIDTGATYDCVNLTIPCVDIRGWIIDDNNGYHGSNGVAGGCNRFSNDVFWSCIPVGTIITIYNGTDANPALPPDDISMTDGNCRLVIPIENTTLFDNNTSTPGAIACDYPLTGWNPGGVWFRIGMRNGGDCVRIVDLAGCEVFSLSYGDVNLNSTIYFPGSGTDDVFFFNGGDPSIQTNWSQGCAGDIASCGSDDQTPGLSNSSLNEDYISQFNHNCEPLTILSTVASNIANASCICDGNATIEASGSIPTYSYEWTDINFISIGQNSATASNLCQGVYHCIVESSIGCLDTIQVTIDQNSSLITPSFTPIEEICSGELFILPSNSNNGITGTWSPIINNTSTTNYTFTPDAGQCAIDTTLTVIVNQNSIGTDIQTKCDSYTWIDGNTYTLSNNSAIWILTNTAGCDSIVTLDLTITNSNSGTDTQSACDTYTWIDGNTYTATNNSATVMLSTIDGCDSLVTLDLTINNSYSTTDVQGACDSYTWIDGNTYTTSNNTASFMLSSMTGCDSLVTLDLTIDNSLLATDAQSACDSYTWIDGVTYTSSNNTATILLTASGGCDSLVTLDLTIGNSNTGIDTQNACDTYTWIDGNTYTTSNNSATWILTNASGCDSTVTLDLTITNSNSGTDTQTACDTYTWIDGNTYTTSNNSATWILTNTAGCDSTVTLDLTINNTPSFTISGTDPSVCNASDGSITISGLNANTSYTLGYDSLNIASQVSLMTTDVTGKFVINGLLAGVYTNFSISLNGCEHTSVDVIDLNNPGAPIIDNQSSLTECDTYTLADITGSNLSGNESYYTEANGGGTPLNAGDVISATQTIYIYDILGTCADESSFTITVDYTPSLTDPGPQDSCESYFLPLSISGTNLSGNENYYSDLQNNGGTVIVDAITSSQTVYIYDANGACSNEISFEITINELPTLVSFTGEGTYCEGEAINNLFAEVSGTPDYTLEYTLNGNPLSITSSSSNIDLGNTEGVYVLTSLTDNSCDISLSETQTININTTPDAPIVGQDESYCSNVVPEDIQASGSTGGYSWYIDASLSELIGSTQSYTPDVIMGSTSYYVTVTENGCEGLPTEVSITIEDCQIIIPTAFTPNDDQINDTWELGNIDDIYPNNVVSVYNRWGNKVYESDKGAYNQRPWNGTFNQETLPVASYYFIIEFNNNSSQNKTGIVSIVK